MKLDPNKLFKPYQRMPIPNTFFFIFTESGKFVPAILTQYCNSDTFYKNCIMFNENGTTQIPVEDGEKYLLGWHPMFEGIKTFNINYNQ